MKRALRSLFLLILLASPLLAEDIVVYPYLQNRTSNSADLLWVSTRREPVLVEWLNDSARSVPVPVSTLDYHQQERKEFPQLPSSPRYLHKVTLRHPTDVPEITYRVLFPKQPFESTFRTLPQPGDSVRLIAYADSETEPESTGKRAKWGTPGDPFRRYLVDQTTGYEGNLQVIKGRKPDAVMIAGDLVESGGEQRDWDEFWRHQKELVGSVEILPAPGNHEYWAGPVHGRYSEDGSRRAIAKYRTYFHPEGKAEGALYYAKQLGPVTLISLDSGDGLPHQSEQDSNFYLQAAGRFSPGFQPGGDQVEWLTNELAEAQKAGQFIVVMFHHCPYSSGTHGFPAGRGEGFDEQSGQPLRSLTPILLRYGVHLVVSGHDEMFERSEVSGEQVLSDGKTRPHTLQVYDVGVGGDGLRGPERTNSFSRFLASKDSPEKWDGSLLVEGGRHYGHLEINVNGRPGAWEAKLTPVYILPNKKRNRWRFERRTYEDAVKISADSHGDE